VFSQNKLSGEFKKKVNLDRTSNLIVKKRKKDTQNKQRKYIRNNTYEDFAYKSNSKSIKMIEEINTKKRKEKQVILDFSTPKNKQKDDLNKNNKEENKNEIYFCKKCKNKIISRDEDDVSLASFSNKYNKKKKFNQNEISIVNADSLTLFASYNNHKAETNKNDSLQTSKSVHFILGSPEKRKLLNIKSYSVKKKSETQKDFLFPFSPEKENISQKFDRRPSVIFKSNDSLSNKNNNEKTQNRSRSNNNSILVQNSEHSINKINNTTYNAAHNSPSKDNIINKRGNISIRKPNLRNSVKIPDIYSTQIKNNNNNSNNYFDKKFGHQRKNPISRKESSGEIFFKNLKFIASTNSMPNVHEPLSYTLRNSINNESELPLMQKTNLRKHTSILNSVIIGKQQLMTSKSLKIISDPESEQEILKMKKIQKLNNLVQKDIFGLNDYNISDFFQDILSKKQKKVDLLNLRNSISKIDKLYRNLIYKVNSKSNAN